MPICSLLEGKVMQVDDGRIRFRTRTYWEAVDLGARLVAEHPFYYAALMFCTIFPIYFLLTLIFWQHPFWIIVLLWWLKPMFEGGVLHAMSTHLFAPMPSFSGSLKQAWRLLFRRRIIGDLLWRRFSIHRALLLPVTLLEQLPPQEHKKRAASVSRYGNTQSAWLTFFGIHFENMLLYALLIAMVWLLLGKDASEVVLPGGRAWTGLEQQFFWLLQKEQTWIWHLENILYLLVLTLWTPFYVAMGFSLYLQARTVSEAWDIRLIFRRLNERIANKIFTLLAVLMFSGSLLFPSPAPAETLPNAKQVQQNVDKSIGKKPFVHLQEKSEYCWQECQESTHHLPNFNAISSFAKVLYWILALALILLSLFLIYHFGKRWLKIRDTQNQESLPENIFGLDVRSESLPKNVAQTACHLFDQDPRAALSLLYRGLLHHLLHKEILTIRSSATESDVLRQIKTQHPILSTFAQNLTHEWIYLAYAHRLPEKDTFISLCNQYQQLIASNNTGGTL